MVAAAFPFSCMIPTFKNTNTGSTRSLHTVTRSCLSDNATSLFHAARHTVDSYVKSGMVIGLGSGNASGMAIQYLGQQLRAGALEDIRGIPTRAVGIGRYVQRGCIEDMQEQYNDVNAVEMLKKLFGRVPWKLG